jgi:hypothetical protein
MTATLRYAVTVVNRESEEEPEIETLIVRSTSPEDALYDALCAARERFGWRKPTAHPADVDLAMLYCLSGAL